MHQHMRDLREDKDLSQKEMAELLNVAQTTYSDYELGKINVPVEILIRLARFHGTSVDFLLGLTDDPAPYKRARNSADDKDRP